jgi:hypothetical protein
VTICNNQTTTNPVGVVVDIAATRLYSFQPPQMAVVEDSVIVPRFSKRSSTWPVIYAPQSMFYQPTKFLDHNIVTDMYNHYTMFLGRI